uniref:Uncharacterized protein LOC112821878 n=1 Tax=Callorhinus ursinus TaxID=34884 RepID=A0A3Q7NUD8_CALUR|nr:uncharacterized protein LOC112821878 [Callorhinus ursinus]
MGGGAAGPGEGCSAASRESSRPSAGSRHRSRLGCSARLGPPPPPPPQGPACAGRARPLPACRPPGSTPARAAHALRPPLKGPARSRRALSLWRPALRPRLSLGGKGSSARLSPLCQGAAKPARSRGGSSQRAARRANCTERKLHGDAGLGRPAVGNFLKEAPRRGPQGVRSESSGLEDRVLDSSQSLVSCGTSYKSLPSVGLGFPMYQPSSSPQSSNAEKARTGSRGKELSERRQIAMGALRLLSSLPPGVP